MCAAAATGDWWARGIVGQKIGGAFSCESEHDLAVMVSEFVENGGGGVGGGNSSGGESWCSSDSESNLESLRHIADKISFYKRSGSQNENELRSIVRSMLSSIKETDLHPAREGPCCESCIRFLLVKLLRLSGYDAAVCYCKWQRDGKVPGGDNEYIDVVNWNNSGSSERLIIDIDFRSHFDIARPAKSYDRILRSLPSVYVGSMPRLEHFLKVMAEAAKSSLEQASMPIPPWRSLSYLQAKFCSPYERQVDPDGNNIRTFDSCNHCLCSEHLKKLQSSILSEMEEERTLKPIISDNNLRRKIERRRHSIFIAL